MYTHPPSARFCCRPAQCMGWYESAKCAWLVHEEGSTETESKCVCTGLLQTLQCVLSPHQDPAFPTCSKHWGSNATIYVHKTQWNKWLLVNWRFQHDKFINSVGVIDYIICFCFSPTLASFLRGRVYVFPVPLTWSLAIWPVQSLSWSFECACVLWSCPPFDPLPCTREKHTADGGWGFSLGPSGEDIRADPTPTEPSRAQQNCI